MDTGGPENLLPELGEHQINPLPQNTWGDWSGTKQYDELTKANTGFIYTPQQLGWDDTASKRFTDAGIANLPGFMNKNDVYSNQFHLGSGDPIQSYIDLHNTSYEDATKSMSGAGKSYQALFGSGAVDPTTAGDAGKEAYMRGAFGNIYNAKDSWWDRNSPWVMGLGGIASVGLGALAGGALGVGTGIGAGAEAGAAGAGGLSGLEMGADLGFSAANLAPGGMAGGIAGGSASAGSLLGGAISGGAAAGADVGMGAGTSWLTDLGLPASYGNDLGALLSYGGDKIINLDWGKLATDPKLLSNLLSGTGLAGAAGIPGQATNTMGGSTSAPQTSQISPSAPIGGGQPTAPATMPTSSMMQAFGYKNEKPDYQKYFQTIF